MEAGQKRIMAVVILLIISLLISFTFWYNVSKDNNEPYFWLCFANETPGEFNDEITVIIETNGTIVYNQTFVPVSYQVIYQENSSGYSYHVEILWNNTSINIDYLPLDPTNNHIWLIYKDSQLFLEERFTSE